MLNLLAYRLGPYIMLEKEHGIGSHSVRSAALDWCVI